MKLNHIIVAAAVVMAGGANANANLLFDAYVGATGGLGGVTLFTADHGHGYGAQSVGAIAGFDIPLVRLEAEYNYLNTRDTSANIAMANAYLKMPSPLISPYIGAGAGMVFDGDANINSTAAYQAMIGLTFKMPVLPLKLDAEARALYSHDVVQTADSDMDMLHYDVRAKLRYIF